MAKRISDQKGTAGTREHGVHLVVPGTALIAQAEERIRWHRQNASLASKEAADLKADGRAASGEEWRHRSRLNDLERRANAHLEYARFLTFLKRHLAPRRRYRLGLSDMATLEITPKGLYV